MSIDNPYAKQSAENPPDEDKRPRRLMRVKFFLAALRAIEIVGRLIGIFDEA